MTASRAEFTRHGSHLIGIPAIVGVPSSVAAATLTATYNDLEGVKKLFEANKGQIAGTGIASMCWPARAGSVFAGCHVCCQPRKHSREQAQWVAHVWY